MPKRLQMLTCWVAVGSLALGNPEAAAQSTGAPTNQCDVLVAKVVKSVRDIVVTGRRNDTVELRHFLAKSVAIECDKTMPEVRVKIGTGFPTVSQFDLIAAAGGALTDQPAAPVRRAVEKCHADAIRRPEEWPGQNRGGSTEGKDLLVECTIGTTGPYAGAYFILSRVAD
jgi:hypothetical protein